MNSPASKDPASPKGTAPSVPTKKTGDDSRAERSTGPRMMMGMPEPVIREAPTPEPMGLHPSVTPESLRKPYASLVPQKRDSTSLNTPPPNSSTAAESTPALRSRPARGTCRKHHIAKGRNGECMLCAKEAANQNSGFDWKLIVLLMLVAIAGASLAALLR